MRRLTPFLALFVALTIAPLVLRAQAPTVAAAQSAPPALSQTVTPLPGYPEQEVAPASTNDKPADAELIGSPDLLSWSQAITGTIGSSSDVDYYQLTVVHPASKLKISLDGLPADYDLVLGGGIDPSKGISTTDIFLPGLENITQVGGSINSIGGSINSIGGSINSIGGSINSIGGSINSIGGSINSIGGSINSISAHSGTISETIETEVWLPGTYYIVVATNNGEHSTTPYKLNVELTGSGLLAPPPVPEVALYPYQLALPHPASAFTTLYIYNSARMGDVYSNTATITSDLGLITNSVNALTRITTPITPGAPIEYGFAVDLAKLAPVVTSTKPLSDVYALWDQNKANPLYANYIAGLIDKVIEAATTDGVSGPGTTFANADYIYSQVGGTPTSFPNLRNIVLIGGDEVLPFYRVPDLTTVANEADYAAYLAAVNPNGAIIDPNSAQGAALRYRMLLTDNVYGTDKPYRFYGFPFYLPHLAVGRIVEQPNQIASYLNFYANAVSYLGLGYPGLPFQINASSGLPSTPTKRAFVSGYDFLQDEATQVEDILQRTGLVTTELNTLNNNDWQKPEVEQAWFDGALNTDFPDPSTNLVSGTAKLNLSSVNAHFDHWQLLPAKYDATTTLLAQRVLTPTNLYPGYLLYFGGTLGYSVGCHSGYSLFDGAVPSTLANQALYQADFPQALNTHGGNWVGNTGYGYGSPDGVDYSEQLAVLYTEELARTVLATSSFTPTTTYTIGATIGEALVNAKQRYVRNAASLSAYDYKVLTIATLYGLPFIRTSFTNPLPPPSEDPSPLPGLAPLEARAPAPPSSNGRLTRTLTFTIGLTETNYVYMARTGSTVLKLAPGDFTIEDEFKSGNFPITDTRNLLRVFEDNQIGAPALPAFAYDIGALSSEVTTTTRLKVRDVIFLGGSYGSKAAFNPQITQIVTDTTTPIISTTAEPNFLAGAGVWYPDKFFGFSSVGESEQQRDQLTAFAAQLRGDANGETGLLRPYTKMVFQVIYEDPTISTTLNADTAAPIIESVAVRGLATPLSLAATGGIQTQVVVTASDSNGSGEPLNVSAVYVANGDAWVPVDFTGPNMAGQYLATIPVRPANARFIVRATDSAGNSSYYTAKGHLAAQDFTLTWLPLIVR